MRDPGFCTGGLHEPDGVHLKTKGYTYMWDKARRVAAGLDATGSITVAAAGPAELPASLSAATPAKSKFELAAAPAAPAGAAVVDEPKVYVLRVKRDGASARTN
jgi:hypothetical protein